MSPRHREREQGQFTVQAEVGPGDVTGVYHITFCNLPFDASWQQIKDWIRPRCHVDRVEVFPSSTSGWVRVRGKENFEAAWDVINGGSFHGRALIASDKNKTQSIKIKELLDFSPESVRDRRRSGKAPMTQPTSPTLCASPVSTIMTPQSTEGSYTRGHALPAPAHYPTQPMGASRNPVLAAYHAAYYARPDYYSTPKELEIRQAAPPTAPQSETRRGAPTEADYADHYKVLLKNIPPRCGAKDIDLWVRRKLNNAQRAVNGVDVPTDESGMHSRGPVYVRLNNTADPAHVVKKLHQHTFRGRTVVASLLLDGSDPTKEESAKEKPAKEKEPKASSSKATSSSPQGRHQRLSSGKPSPSGPLVVEGSTKKGRGKVQ